MSTITLSHKASKLMKLCDAEGFETLDDLLALSITDSVCPAICMTEGCDYTAEMEPDQDQGFCGACGGNTVTSALARAFLLYHRDDFAHGNWPQDLKDRVVRQGRRVDAAYKRFARDTFGGVGANELQLARFVLAEVPKAAVGPYLRQGVAPPTIVDEIIGATYYAIVGKFGAARKRRSPSINS